MGTLQRQRRTNPYPFTWEVPAAVLLCVVYALVMAIHLGRGAACYVATGRWQLTPASNLISALPGILTGDASAGLAEASCRATSASSFAVWVTLALLVVTALLVVAGRLLLTRWGPGRMKGLSTAGDAETILGLSRLREVRHIIRPDLHPRKRDQR